ncbi:unnamed protein product [Auanema sp. JU1783]|nr:unnamed protein product [Auanema sp. JU1783]
MVNHLILPSSPPYQPKKDIRTPLTITATGFQDFEDIPPLVRNSAKQQLGYDMSNLLITVPDTLEQQLLNLLQLDPVAFWTEVKHSTMRDTLADAMIMKIRQSFQNPSEPTNALYLSRILIAMNLQNDVISGLTSDQRHRLASGKSTNLLQIRPPTIQTVSRNEQLGKHEPSIKVEPTEHKSKENNSVLMKLLEEPTSPKRRRVDETYENESYYTFEPTALKRKSPKDSPSNDSFTMMSL